MYATDFGDMSPGGIQTFVRLVGQCAPSDMDIDYFGVGSPEALPRAADGFVQVLSSHGAGRLNVRFTRALLGHRQKLSGYDAIAIHRPEYALAVPRGPALTHVLHGGTWNAWRTGQRHIGTVYPFVEMIASARSSLTVSVAPEELARGTRWLTRRLERTLVPVDSRFYSLGPTDVRPGRLVTCSRLVPEKQIDTLIELAAEADMPLVVFGDGPELGALRRLASERVATVEFRGFQSSLEIARDYRSCGGVYVSASRFEGFGIAAAEAAVAGMGLMSVGNDSLKALTAVGLEVGRFDTTHQAGRALRAGIRPVPNPALARQKFSPETVAAKFWAQIEHSVS